MAIWGFSGFIKTQVIQGGQLQHPLKSRALPVASLPMKSYPKLCANVSRLPMSEGNHPLESPSLDGIFVDFACINEGDDATKESETVDPFSTPSDQEDEQQHEQQEVDEDDSSSEEEYSSLEEEESEQGDEQGDEQEGGGEGRGVKRVMHRR